MISYKCCIYKQDSSKPNRICYIPFIPRIGETLTLYFSKEHQFVPHKVLDVEYVIDGASKYEPFIKITI